LRKKGKDELNIVKPQLSEVKTEKEIKVIPKEFEIKKPQPIVNKPEMKTKKEVDYSDWEFPPLDILSSASSEVYVSDKVLKENAKTSREKLAQFDIPVAMRDVNIGPTVLQYTLQPSEGIKLNKITALKNDLALALAAKSIRIEAPIPGKSLVGIEVPNDKRMIVHLRELLESEEFKSVNQNIPHFISLGGFSKLVDDFMEKKYQLKENPMKPTIKSYKEFMKTHTKYSRSPHFNMDRHGFSCVHDFELEVYKDNKTERSRDAIQSYIDVVGDEFSNEYVYFRTVDG